MPRRKKADRLQFNVRMREVLRAKIEKAANARDVSLNTEAVDRLEKSFLADERREDVNQAALFAAMGGEENYRAFRFLFLPVPLIERETGKTWQDDPVTYQRVLGAFMAVMQTFGANSGLPEEQANEELEAGFQFAKGMLAGAAASAKKSGGKQ